jgi:integrase
VRKQKEVKMASIRKLRSGKWQVVIRKSNHKAIYKTFIEKVVARKFAREVEQQIEKDIYTDYGNAETITIKDLIIKYRDEIVVEHKAKKSTTHKLNKLLRYDVAAQFLLRLRSSHIYNFQKKLEAEGSAPKTINIYVQLLHQIWTTAKKKWSINLPAQSPFELVTLDKVDNERDRVLTHKEYDTLIAKAAESKLLMLRDFIEFLYCTGARYSEAMNLLREDVDFEKRVGTFRNTKNGEDRTIPLADNVLAILKRYPFGKTFFRVTSYDSYNWFFNQACKRANIENFVSHDLRACWITNALLSGMSEASVASISGHKDFRSMKRYTRIKAQDLIEDVNNISVIRENKNR